MSKLTYAQLEFLSRLPLYINSALDTKQVVSSAIEQLKNALSCEAATVFLLDDTKSELLFWAVKGGIDGLENIRIPAKRGIVGWVIENGSPVKVDDVAKDPRFFVEVDRSSEFKTRNLVCTPLLVRGNEVIGAIQAINSINAETFSDTDLDFLNQIAASLAIAIDNARNFQNLSEANKKLTLLDKRKQEIVTLLHHEFRTPLNVIQSSVDLLTSGVLNKEGTEKIQTALFSSVTRLTKLVSQMRNVSTLSKDKTLPVKLESITISQVFEELREYFEEASKKRQLALNFAIQEGLTDISADPVLIRVVLKNLVSNAIRFTPNGGTISVQASKEPGLVRFEVQDTGIGIDESQIPLIFEKFYEVGDVLQHSSGEFEFKSGSLGLGLPTVKAILEAHGSSIEVKSRIGHGSSFVFRLKQRAS